MMPQSSKMDIRIMKGRQQSTKLISVNLRGDGRRTYFKISFKSILAALLSLYPVSSKIISIFCFIFTFFSVTYECKNFSKWGKI
jgi:hypothetical protein